MLSGDLTKAHLAKGEVVLLQHEIPLATIEAALDAAAAAGAVSVLNTAPFRAEAAKLLGKADYVVANETEFDLYSEALKLSGRDRAARMRAFVERTGRTIIVTLGGDGVIAASPEGDLSCPGAEDHAGRHGRRRRHFLRLSRRRPRGRPAVGAGAPPRRRGRLARLPEARRATRNPACQGRRRGAGGGLKPAGVWTRNPARNASCAILPEEKMSLELYAAYLAACIVIIMVPGPTVTLIIASSMRHGVRAGLANVAGTQAGIAIMIAVAGIGLTTVIEAMGHWFELLRLLGAAYLIWMGWQMIRSSGRHRARRGARARPRGGFFLQGFLVAVSNPKTLIFFGAFFPQFIDPAGNYALQISVMGVTALIFAAISDSAYALVAGRAGSMLSARRVRLLSRISGGFLIGGGVWLAFSRAK